MEQRVDWFESPVGPLRLAWDGDALCELFFAEGGHSMAARRAPVRIRSALEAYFEGDVAAIDSLAVQPAGTVFQRKVWAALREIPAGTTISYGELARRIGQPGAARAVGLANGSNPISIVIPCHRVIGADGRLTGYGGGLDRKRWLLAHERDSTPFALTGPRPARE